MHAVKDMVAVTMYLVSTHTDNLTTDTWLPKISAQAFRTPNHRDR